MKKEVEETVISALEELRAGWGIQNIPEVDVEIPKNESMGHVATTVALRLTKVLKIPPRKIAEDILSRIDTEKGPFDRIEIGGAGFINFTYGNRYFHNKLRALLEETDLFFRTELGKGRKIQVEFVSANPTGPLHIGHGRGAALGNALCNLLKTAGFDVEREFYINDAGLQVKLLGLSVYAAYQKGLGSSVQYPVDGYKGEYITAISSEIINKTGDKYLNIRFEECSDFFIGFSYRKMLADIARDLKNFGIEFDSWQSEKDLYSKGKVRDSLNFLDDRGMLYEKDGAKWFRSTAFGDDKDRVIVKKDGEYTYFASDIAYHKDKLDWGFDTIIDIWGADHHGYVPRLRSVLKAFGLPEEKFKVILVQIVSLLRQGRPIQMSKRSGEFITLREVVDEVGADITKFIFLTRRSDSHLDFDLEIAKNESSENPVFYVQYAFARISSIFRQAEERGMESPNSGGLNADLSLLIEDDDLAIIRKLLHYQLVFESSVLAFEPHRITYYLQELAGQFHSYYNRHRVISHDKSLAGARLCLCKAVQTVLKEGLRILGVSAPEKM